MTAPTPGDDLVATADDGHITRPTVTVAARPAIIDHPQHEHTLSRIEGYVVRQTIGAWQQTHPARVGRDVAVVHGSGYYSLAIERALAFRDLPRTWAVIDCLYSCGCRS